MIRCITMIETFPEKLDSSNPAEVLEYHITAMKEMQGLPQDFKLSDNARDYIIDVIHRLWEQEHGEERITQAIFGFCSGFYLGKNE